MTRGDQPPRASNKRLEKPVTGAPAGSSMHLNNPLVWELTTLDAGATVPVSSFGDSRKAATMWSIGSFGVCTIGLGRSYLSPTYSSMDTVYV